MIPPLPENHRPTRIGEWDENYDYRKSRRDDSIVENSIGSYPKNPERVTENHVSKNHNSTTSRKTIVLPELANGTNITIAENPVGMIVL